MEEFNGPVIIHGELQIPGPVRPEPAAQFGSHVGVDGNLDLAGGLTILETGNLRVVNSVHGVPASFEGGVAVRQDLDVGSRIRCRGDVGIDQELRVGSTIRCATLAAEAIFTPSNSTATVDNRLNVLQSAVNTLQQRVFSVDNRLTALQGQVDELQQRVEALENS
jgi:hypothetical protein